MGIDTAADNDYRDGDGDGDGQDVAIAVMSIELIESMV